MSLLKTKPRYCAFAEAAENGWINGKTGELLVSIRGLKSKLALEQTASVETVETKEEIVMIEETKTEEVVQLKEQTVKKPKKNQKIIAEVVEHVLDGKEIVGE